MARARLWLVVVAMVGGRAVEAGAQDDPANFYFETAARGTTFGWSFGSQVWLDEFEAIDPEGLFPSCAKLTHGSDAAFDEFGLMVVFEEGLDEQGMCADDCALAYDDRGFIMDPLEAINLDVEVTRHVYVPPTSDFARWADRIRNVGGDAISIVVGYRGSLGWVDEVDLVATSSGDAVVSSEDDWLVVDDGQGEGELPALAVVWSSPDAETRASWASLDGTFFHVDFDVDVAVGSTTTTMLFAVQAATPEDAVALATEIALLSGSAADRLDDDIDGLANFVPDVPGAPRVRMNGPYTVDEGGALVLRATVEDPEGETMTFEWDLDDDGQFDDLQGTLEAPVSAVSTDGPRGLRIGLRVTDAAGHVVERHSTVSVVNQPPVVSSTPPPTARTGERYEYTIEATDFAADEIHTSVEQGPVGLTVSAAGVVEWVPAADGAGPEVPVVLVVEDDDGGQTRHAWTVQVGGGPHVDPGGPYRVAEGERVVLAPVIADPEGDAVELSWDLNSDGVFGDSDDPQVEWSAAGIDGPTDSFRVPLMVSDGEFEVVALIPVEVTNGAPTFVSVPPPVAVVDREWVYRPEVVDPGDDEVGTHVDERPPTMVVDADGTLRWTPTEIDRATGTFSLQITAEDEDGGHSRQDVVIEVRDNAPPPVPVLVYPTGEQPVGVLRPTIILENAADADGDPLEYTIQVDRNVCFCTGERMDSGALRQGEIVIEWQLPRDLVIEDGEHGNQFYLRRWSSDGLQTSDLAQAVSLFEVVLDADEAGSDAGCACRAAGPRAPADALGSAAAALVCLLLVRRRRRGRPTP